MHAVVMRRAREALRLADDHPRTAADLAAEIAEQALTEHDLAAAAVARRALGLAAIHVDDLNTAIQHLRAGIALGRRAGSSLVAAEARMTLAFALNRRGEPRQALREIDTALMDLTGVARARAQFQRGAILHQLGRLDDALASYRVALPTLRRNADHAWMVRLLNNRGVLHGHRAEFVAAQADLEQAEQLSSRLGLELWLAFAHQNLGWVHALRGDIPPALRYLDMAESRMIELGSQVGSVLCDRAELLLSARLVTEARATAQRAVAEFEREGRRIALPEVRLQLAQATALDGDPAAALRHARRALREFSRQGRQEWAAWARFIVLTCRAAGEGRHRITLAEVERSAQALIAAGHRAAAIDARLLAAELALDRGNTARSIAQLLQASRAGRRGPATSRARAWYARALLRRAQGDHRGATIAVRSGLRVLDEHRASLAATDLRAHASAHRIKLAALGLRIAFEDGQPERILCWADQSRATHLLLRPARPPDDPVLVTLLAELRRTASEIDKGQAAGRTAGRLVQRQIALETQIRDYCRHQRTRSSLGHDRPASAAELIVALGEAALIEFIVLDDQLSVISVAEGRVQLQPLGGLRQVHDLVERIPFALHVLARDRATASTRSAAATLMRHAAEQLDQLVLRPLRDRLADRPLVIVPTGPLQSLPWSVLPSCRGRPVTVAPSAALWHEVATRPADHGQQVAVAAGPDLPGGHEEAAAVATIHGTVPLLGSAASVDAVASALGHADVVHLAAHGRVNAHNPLFSSLRFADGPFTVYDLERLHRVAGLVILASCDIGRAVVRSGDELLGLSAAFLTHGTRQLVASVVPIPDVETTPLMIEFHRLLEAGHSSPTALAQAQERLIDGYTSATAAAAGFVCIGAGYRMVRR